ncbi:uncharacterized protein LOC124133803 [Haliotis rufescens]|uniref:uncharacterized protein LOC124133803 n=1 Tax=Haliotis rufescens TaxID=6454 RepID=UPI00201F27D5|nr:uncharacterized protein LOC124133803 [Haliotis rufescens]
MSLELFLKNSCSLHSDTVNITLLGEIDHTNRGDLTDGLNRLITELGEIPGKVDVKFTANTQTDCNYTTTYVQLYSSLENGTLLDSASVNMIFESNSDEVLNEYLPLPLYPPRQEEKSTVKRPHDSWDTDQYVLVVLLPLGLVLMIVLPLMAFGILKRKSDTSQCIDDENDQINSFGMDLPRNRNPNRPGTITGSLQGASVSPDGNPCLHFHDVDEGALDTHCDDTSNIHGATGDMTLVPWSQEAASVSLDDNARHGDITPLDIHRHATINIHNGTGDMTLDLSSLHGASVSESVNTHLHDEATFEARHHVAAHLPVDVLHLRQTINYEQLDHCEEEDTDSTVTDDTDVENISEEDPYVDVVVLST